jgi:hypothetical protein
VINSFAGAYGQRNPGALDAILAPDVTRVSAGAVEHGRAAVLAEYRSQFADRSIIGYRVSALQLRPGWVARAAGQYTVVRSGQADLGGSVVLGVERLAGRPRIVLIATQSPAP